MLSIIKLRLLRLRDEYMIFVVMTVMALGLTFVFGASMTGYLPKVYIVDEDQSVYSGMLYQEIATQAGYNFVAAGYKEAQAGVEDGSALTAVVIPKGFENAVSGGKQASVGMIKLKDDVNIMTLQKYVTSSAVKMIGSIRIADITADFISQSKPEADREAIEKSAYRDVMDSWRFKNPMRISEALVDVAENNGYDGMKHSMIGFSVFFSMYTMVFGVGTILYDKQHKIWQRMLISPVSRASILGGNLVTAFLMGAVQLGVLILAGKYLLGVDWGNSTAGVLMVAGAFIFAVTCMGLLLSGIVKTHAQLAAISPIILTSTAMLGGCMWPLEIVNMKVLLILANFTPQKWAVQGMEAIASYGKGFEAAVLPTAVLIGMGLLFFAIGARLVKFE